MLLAIVNPPAAKVTQIPPPVPPEPATCEPSSALLPTMVQLVTVKVPAMLHTPAPANATSLVTVQLVIQIVPVLTTPPPAESASCVAEKDELPTSVQPYSVAVPSLYTPPPSRATK